MTLDVSDEETAALTGLLSDTIDADRYPLSPRILTLLRRRLSGCSALRSYV